MDTLVGTREHFKCHALRALAHLLVLDCCQDR